MVDHIYGRANVISRTDRPHMFIKELSIYVDYWMELLAEAKETIDTKRRTYIETFHKNMMEGISYYRHLSDKATGEWHSLAEKFIEGLGAAEKQLEESFSKFKQASAVVA